MKFVNALITDQSIVMVFDEGPKVCSVSHPSFNKVKDLIQRGRPMDALAEFDITLKLKKHTSGAFYVDDGVVYMDKSNPVPMPTALSSRVIQFADSGLNFTPLINLWNNIQRNPNPESIKDLYAFLEHNGISVTEDGCFCAYKGVTSNYKSTHAGVWKKDAKGSWYFDTNDYYDNTPGGKVVMPREEVDDNREQTCSSGLHVAAYEYASTWSERIVLIKVDPADVVSVPVDYNGQKMRTCGYEVLKDVTEELKTPLYTDENDPVYDDANDEDWDDGFYGEDADFENNNGWDDDEDEEVETVEAKKVVPDKSGRVCVPSVFVKALGLKPGNIANVIVKPGEVIRIITRVDADVNYRYAVDRDSNIRLSKKCVAESGILNRYRDVQVEIENDEIVLS